MLLFSFFLSLSNLIAQETPLPFRKQVLDDKILIGYGLAIGDVDGDKKPDIILADKKQIVWYRNGDWKKTVIAENLTESDNVCIAVADIDGDGKVEIAAGAQWNPGETTDDKLSGAVFYLVRPTGEEGLWRPVRLHHEPTVHRMKWMKSANGKFYLVVAPLHGRGNKQGEGVGAKLLAYSFEPGVAGNWPVIVIDSNFHLTHNFTLDLGPSGVTKTIYLASKEGIKPLNPVGASDKVAVKQNAASFATNPAGEISLGSDKINGRFLSTIEPMHGNSVVVYENEKNNGKRTILDSTLKEGHGLATGDLLKLGTEQVIAGWRQPDANGKIGLKIYLRTQQDKQWKMRWIDDGGIAVEDVQVADLNGDGKPEIIASGRSTHNVIIYWNDVSQ